MKAVKSLILPALSLGLVRAAVLTRMTRSSMLEVLGEDYIRTARPKGYQKESSSISMPSETPSSL